MKFTATIVSLAVCLAMGSAGVDAHAHLNGRNQHAHIRRTGPSATYSPAPAPSATSAPAPAPNPASPSGSGTIKRGLGFNDVSLTKQFNSQQVSWAYNWDSQHSGDLPAGVTYFPLLWSMDPIHTSGWNDHATAAIAAGAQYLFGFNEPDLSSQANMIPGDAANAWRTYMQPFAGKAKLVAPAITNGGAPMGTAWLDNFMSACSDCQVDAVAIHIYDSATNVGYYQNYIKEVVQKYGKPVFITEMGAAGTVQEQQAFLQQMLPFLDGLEGVAHYAWFGAFVGNLVNADGSLTALGQTYATAH